MIRLSDKCITNWFPDGFEVVRKKFYRMLWDLIHRIGTAARFLPAPLFLLIMLGEGGDISALANSYSEHACEDGADDLKRFAFWMFILGTVLTASVIGAPLGALLVPIATALFILAEVWWMMC